MTGIKRHGISLQTEHILGREKPCLCVSKDNRSIVMGYFVDDEAAKKFWDVLDYIAFDNETPFIEEIMA